MSRRQEQPGVEKGPDAFRTISEVAEDLDLPQHVLRFWETRFPQIRPLKRGGGRRYYRPDDVELLRGIRHLLYAEGYTIRGVQRILKEDGPRHVQALWREVAGEGEDAGPVGAARDARAADEDGPAGEGAADEAHYEDEPPVDGGAERGGLGGLLNFLPARQHGPAEEAPAPRRGGRRPLDDEPEFPQLPLLPDLEPLPLEEPRRREPHLREPGFGEPSRRETGRREPTLAADARREQPSAPVPPGGPRPGFIMRPETPDAAFPTVHGVGDDADDDFRTEPAFGPHPAPFADEDADEPALSASEPRLAVSRTQLTAEDIKRLLATFRELLECQRILAAAREAPADEEI